MEKFYQKLEDPQGKSLFWFEHSGHQLEYDEPAKFAEVLEKQILAISQKD